MLELFVLVFLARVIISYMDSLLPILIFLVGLLVVILTLFSALSTFVLPRAARSQLNRIVFGLLRRVVEFIFRFVKTYERRDAIMASCAVKIFCAFNDKATVDLVTHMAGEEKPRDQAGPRRAELPGSNWPPNSRLSGGRSGRSIRSSSISIAASAIRRTGCRTVVTW